jgi:hypothetical protein
VSVVNGCDPAPVVALPDSTTFSPALESKVGRTTTNGNKRK